MITRGVAPLLAAWLLMTGSAWAQAGLRSASLPDRTPQNPVPAERPDLFLATPRTYVPRSGHEPHRQPHGKPGGTVYGHSYGWVEQPAYTTREIVREREIVLQPPPAPVQALPALPAAPGPPKTFYVIPGCYAGDRRPDPAVLPAGCDPARLREVPPR